MPELLINALRVVCRVFSHHQTLLFVALLSATIGCGDSSSSSAAEEPDADAGDPSPPSGLVAAAKAAEDPVRQAKPEFERALAIIDVAKEVEQFSGYDHVYRPQLLARAGRYAEAVQAVDTTQLPENLFAMLAMIVADQGADDLARELVIKSDPSGLDPAAIDRRAVQRIDARRYAVCIAIGDKEQVDQIAGRYTGRDARGFKVYAFTEQERLGLIDVLLKLLEDGQRYSKSRSDLLLEKAAEVERLEGPEAAAALYQSWLKQKGERAVFDYPIQDGLFWLSQRGMVAEIKAAWEERGPDERARPALMIQAAEMQASQGEAGAKKGVALLEAFGLGHTSPAVYAKAGMHDAYRQHFASFLNAQQQLGPIDSQKASRAASNLRDAGFKALAVQVLLAIPAETRRPEVWGQIALLGAVDQTIEIAEEAHQAIEKNAPFHSQLERSRSALAVVRAYKAEQLWRDGKRDEAAALFDRCMLDCVWWNTNGGGLVREISQRFASLVDRRLALGDIEGTILLLQNEACKPENDGNGYIHRRKICTALARQGDVERAKAFLPNQSSDVQQFIVDGLVQGGHLKEAIPDLKPSYLQPARPLSSISKRDIEAWRQWQLTVGHPIGQAFVPQASATLSVQDLGEVLKQTDGVGLYAIVQAMKQAGRLDEADKLIDLFTKQLDPQVHSPDILAQVMDWLCQRGKADQAIDLGLSYLAAADQSGIGQSNSGEAVGRPREADGQPKPAQVWRNWHHFFAVHARARIESLRLDVDLGLAGRALQTADFAVQDLLRATFDPLIWPIFERPISKPVLDAWREQFGREGLINTIPTLQTGRDW